jgi:periplasmic protein TonB
MIHVVEGRSLPHLPGCRRSAAFTSVALHIGAVGFVLLAAAAVHRDILMLQQRVTNSTLAVEHMIFIADVPQPESGGGGGGGNRQAGPIRRAEAVGTDRVTLRTAKPVAMVERERERPAPPIPALLLDAEPMASGSIDQLGLPSVGASTGTSLGEGSGGGVGEGFGTGIGPGVGPGFGPGSGGGIGGGVYRVGGSVRPPRVITEVRPTYTNRAMVDHIEGSVLLELIVRSDGTTSKIRVIRSLDPGGLDEEAIRAAKQWRFEPGRLNGVAVDVIVALQVDFHLR